MREKGTEGKIGVNLYQVHTTVVQLRLATPVQYMFWPCTHLQYSKIMIHAQRLAALESLHVAEISLQRFVFRNYLRTEWENCFGNDRHHRRVYK